VLQIDPGTHRWIGPTLLYIDPGSGALIWQTVLAFLLGSGYYLRTRVQRVVARLLGRRRDNN
jgi:hypothetical protein